jgi:raffinose/stachyose/melibiose transport system permease protein
MRSIPTELEEAAFLDGCNIYSAFFRIIVPMMRPAIATVTIFTFLHSWNELMFAQIYISDSNLKTLTAGIQTLVGEHSTDWGPVGAGLAIATVPIIIAYLFLSRQVQQSMIAGSIKG